MDRVTRINTSIAQEIGARVAQVAAAVALLDDGATVPFIARYRKEATGGLDDTQLRTLAERLTYLRDMDTRRDAILKSISEQGKLTPALTRAIDAANTKSDLEDLYLPYKPKRRTKAMVAREKGLEPLRDAIVTNRGADPASLATSFLSADVTDVQDALDGARDILVEDLSETPELVSELRTYLEKDAIVTTRVVEGQEEAGAKFADYFDRTEKLATLPAHRALALMRAVNENVIRFDIGPDAGTGKARCEGMVAARLQINGTGPGDRWLRDVAAHAWKARLSNSMTSHLLADLRSRAEGEAIAVFARNLRDLLLAAPAGARPTIGLDPGIRTGVKCAVIDATGKVLETDTLYPFAPKFDLRGAQVKILQMIQRHKIELIAIGNGTASRETDKMVEDALKVIPKGTQKPIKVIVSEAGASVYSASELAAKEFPNLDVSLRGAVSIARRLQDPLSELVKIEPNAIGVGQYQHDVDQKRLAKALQAVVEDAVNAVGVDLNTASAELLNHVAGLTSGLAKAIVEHRDKHGPFRSRKDLLKVKGLGPKTFEQCAGFLRIRDGKEPLDASSVHPEAYDLARQIVIACGRDLKAIQSNPASLKSLKPETFVSKRFGLPTVRDIMSELEKPGRDPRPSFKTATFTEGVNEITDLKPGMRLEGTVTNVVAFGAFVDIGVHQDGLVHVSQLAERFVSNPFEVVKAGDIVQVRVIDVDVSRKRIGLTMRADVEISSSSSSEKRMPSHSKIDPSGKSHRSGKSNPGHGESPVPSDAGALGVALLNAMKKR